MEWDMIGGYYERFLMMSDQEFEAALVAAKSRGALLRLAAEAQKRGDYDAATQARLLWQQWEGDAEDDE